MEKKRILFVCLGNICRSPAGEGVMRHLVKERGLEDVIHIESAGTAGYHIGEPADKRMRSAAKARGYVLNRVAQQFHPRHFDEFDLILVADNDNLHDIRMLDQAGKYRDKVRLMLDYASDKKVTEVPDPYYGGPKGFDYVIDLLEDSCAGLLEELAGPGGGSA